jgi:hypothetical protein
LAELGRMADDLNSAKANIARVEQGRPVTRSPVLRVVTVWVSCARVDAIGIFAYEARDWTIPPTASIHPKISPTRLIT